MPKIKRKDSVLEDDGLNMTPLIDCVFLLLVFFMVTTVFKNPAKLNLTLPDGENPDTLDQRQIIAELDGDGNVALNGNVISMDSFDAQLVSEKKESSTNNLLVKADIEAKHGQLLRIMKMAKEVQMETVAIAVEDLTEE